MIGTSGAFLRATSFGESSLDERRWEFWIDVGGTFTDCLAKPPEGPWRRYKTLSSGVVKGAVGAGEFVDSFVDPSRRGDPDGFWVGWTWRLLNGRGDVEARRTITGFHAETGTLTLDRPLAETPAAGTIYELTAGLEAPLVAVRYLLACPLDKPLPSVRVRLGTTRGTNALLMRRGARVAWVTTQGFGDVLKIGYQARPRLFELNIHKREPLYECVLEVGERIDAEGRILETLDEGVTVRQLEALKSRGIEALAVGFLNSYRNPLHERTIARLAASMGFADISLSSDQASLVKLVARGDTTVVNAYLNPILRGYLRSLAEAWSRSQPVDLRLMTSAGGLVSVDDFEGRDSILSGPAGGVVGLSAVASATRFERVIGFDMGGTSTDVSRFDGRFDYEFETEKAGVRVVAPMLAIHTVAAGGGSVCGFDGVKLTVGPESAGADPGPACYGRGGPLTITDMNVFLGRLPADALPFPLDRTAVRRQLERLSAEIAAATGSTLDCGQLATGYLQIANANMAQAIRSISVKQGFDPREYALVSFGGAAPQHACAVARELGIPRLIDHPQASLLSALGIGMADVRHHAQQGIYQSWETVRDALEPIFASLQSTARDHVRRQGIDDHAITLQSSLELRYAGTDWPLRIEAPSDGDYAAAFARRHHEHYGYVRPHARVEVVAARVEAVGGCGWQLEASTPREPATTPEATAQVHQSPRTDEASGSFRPRGTYRREALRPGDRIDGPALIVGHTSTTVVDDGWQADVWSQGELVLVDVAPTSHPIAPSHGDPIWLEIFHGHLTQIAEQMGLTLRNTASSVNVKERLDYSCALFTREGDLVVNAPHVPVHLGAMGETVRQILHDHRLIQAGDVFITNDPFRGGSHLPDVTVVTPVFDPSGEHLRWFVASRAHHAEIGGITPGSMPPFSRWLVEEGVLLRSFKLIEAGVERLDELQRLLKEAPYPSRDVDANLADVAAQVAANQQGLRDLRSLETRHGWETLARYMGYLQEAAATQMRLALHRIPDGSYEFTDHLDEGAVIRVRLDVQGDRARIDFTGSAAVQSNNLNANRAIVTAAVMYSLRCLIDQPVPLNQGVLAPIELVLPPGMLNPPADPDPARCPAVVAGNVETSQRIVDCLLGAFRAAAASQGTMNNLLFGDATFGYYETICGGAGATPTGPGADAVHTHMTNTRLTDPEVLEQKYPVRLRRFAIRSGSGGAGRFPGGCGVIRELEFLRPLEVSLVTQRRGPYPPFGLAGGQPGQCGQNRLQRANGEELVLPARVALHVEPGDILVIETPGGGGYGVPGCGTDKDGELANRDLGT
jgi:5-oxoprolinase (ATP-hydrolysing)